jgi:hypothetical protein
MNLEKHQDHLKEMYVLRDAYDRDIRALRMHS